MLSDRDQTLLQKTLSYANGYRELGMYEDALAEIAQAAPSLANQKALQQMQLAVLMEARRWSEALTVANTLAARYATDPGNLVNLAYVTRRATSLQAARIILENAAKQFPQEAIIQYNLGCYACCNEDLDTAKKHLLLAFSLDQSYLKMSDTDDDLEALRPWLNSLPRP